MNNIRLALMYITLIFISCDKSEDKTSDGYEVCGKEVSEEMISQHKNLKVAYSNYSLKYNIIELEVDEALNEQGVWYIVASKSDGFQFFEIIYDFSNLKKIRNSRSDGITGCPVSDDVYSQEKMAEKEKQDLFDEIRNRSKQDARYGLCEYRIVFSNKTESLYECMNQENSSSN